MSDKSYANWHAMSDQAVIEQLGEFVKHHRLQQNKTQQQLAKEAGISRSTLSLLERGETVTLNTFIQVLRVLGLLEHLNAFRVEEIISPIELAKKEQQKRKRASGSKNKISDNRESDW
ncbi:MAG: helix-turn-helix domain-containing protein [Gracilimonas sp.]|uniref:helix-turn-helix domain-containing protein n=1 Tax=Gracilimonas sp. TaxID=1974203 RepID=UPI003753424D|nr:helix-turn-helix domain-containing protein [Gracilimonas sp.]